MAKDIVVAGSLTDSMIKAGAKLVKRLDTLDACITSAFWLYISDEKLWRLIICSPKVDVDGPREFYKKIVLANNTATAVEKVVSLNDIGVTGPSNHIVKLIRNVVATENGISEIRFSRCTINGHFIEDSYIYRSCKL